MVEEEVKFDIRNFLTAKGIERLEVMEASKKLYLTDE